MHSSSCGELRLQLDAVNGVTVAKVRQRENGISKLHWVRETKGIKLSQACLIAHSALRGIHPSVALSVRVHVTCSQVSLQF